MIGESRGGHGVQPWAVTTTIASPPLAARAHRAASGIGTIALTPDDPAELVVFIFADVSPVRVSWNITDSAATCDEVVPR